MRKCKIAVVTFTDPRSLTAAAGEREHYNQTCHRQLLEQLEMAQFEALDGQAIVRAQWDGTDNFGVYSVREVDQIAQQLRGKAVDVLVFGMWHWTEPHLPLRLQQQLGLPVALFAHPAPHWAGATCLASTGASFSEVAANNYMRDHARFLGDIDSLQCWLRGAAAVKRMREQTLLLWGGSYSLHMEHLRDDASTVKRRFIAELLEDSEYPLIEKAKTILNSERSRIGAFIHWLSEQGVRFKYDDTMLTDVSLQRQVAVYLACRDYVKEFEVGGEKISGASLKEQPDLSDRFGVTSDVAEAFLNFGVDHEGPQQVIPIVSEGDIKGLITSLLLHNIAPQTPPLFGDLRWLSDEAFVVSNDGASSVFYAGLSNDPGVSLPKVTLRGQCQGKSGAAVGYITPATTLTYARLTRIRGTYVLQYGVAECTGKNPLPASAWGQMWPITTIRLSVPAGQFIQALGSNHLSATVGDVSGELSVAARLLGLKTLRLDDPIALKHYNEQGSS